MKKEQMKTILIVTLSLVIVIGGSFFMSEFAKEKDNIGYGDGSEYVSGEEDDNTSTIPASEQKDHHNIGIEDYLRLKAGTEKSIIYIARPTCTFCQQQGPILKNVAYLYNLNVNYLNTDELSNTEHNQLLKSDDYFKDGYGTPLIVIVQDNKIVGDARGLRSKSNLIDFFKTNGMIQE